MHDINGCVTTLCSILHKRLANAVLTYSAVTSYDVIVSIIEKTSVLRKVNKLNIKLSYGRKLTSAAVHVTLALDITKSYTI